MADKVKIIIVYSKINMPFENDQNIHVKYGSVVVKCKKNLHFEV